jgi:transcriptional regulator with XRE-family HTH domain
MEQKAQPNRLKELRIRSRLTQQEVATLLGVTSAVVSRHETGEMGLSHEAVAKYAKLYKIWSYEIFQKPIRGKDAWTEEGEYTAEEPADAPLDE